MNIILEGPDNSGKTHLANQLKEYFNLIYTHTGGPTTTPLNCCKQQHARLISGGYVFDRCTPISEQVYGHFRPTFTQYIDSFKRKAIFVYCRPSNEVLLDEQYQSLSEHDTKETADFNKEDFIKFINMYDEIFKDIPHILYDWTTEENELESIYERIIESSLVK